MTVTTPADLLKEIRQLASSMIDLADSNQAVQSDIRCRMICRTLRDHGDNLLQMADKELTDLSRQEDSGNGQPGSGTNGAGKTVLIVDDDPDILKYLTFWFEDHGFTTRTAKNGLEALKEAHSDRPDLITMDISMPEKSGVSTYRELKTDKDLGGIPVIILTAIGQPFNDFITRNRHLPNPDGFIAKPIDLETLGETVKQLVN